MSSVPRSPRVVRASILASAGVGLGLLLLFAWASGGILGGALLGAVGCVGWYVVHSASVSFSIIPIFGFVGGVTGAIAGVMVGTYCWRAGRRPASA